MLIAVNCGEEVGETFGMTNGSEASVDKVRKLDMFYVVVVL